MIQNRARAAVPHTANNRHKKDRHVDRQPPLLKLGPPFLKDTFSAYLHRVPPVMKIFWKSQKKFHTSKNTLNQSKSTWNGSFYCKILILTPILVKKRPNASWFYTISQKTAKNRQNTANPVRIAINEQVHRVYASTQWCTGSYSRHEKA